MGYGPFAHFKGPSSFWANINPELYPLGQKCPHLGSHMLYIGFGIQFNLLLSPYPCFISLLYLDLYVLGDDALIS